MPDIEIIIKGSKGSGKTTISALIEKYLKEIGMRTTLIDGYAPPLLSKIQGKAELELNELQPMSIIITTENTQIELSREKIFYPNI